MNSFDTQNAKGIAIQDKVKAHLEARGNTVIDVSQDKSYQARDIDFLVRKDGREVTLEVKMDNSLFRSRNIFFEAGFQRGDFYTTGWLQKCDADYMCVYDNYRKHGIIFDYPAAVSLLEKYARVITFYDRYDNKQGRAYLLPLQVAFAKKIVYYEWED